MVKLRFHWPIVAIAAVAAALIFTNLGSDYLWEDEGDTAAFAVNILKFGVPRAWDGVTFIDSDGGAPLNENLTLVSHPWLQYYLTAASFAVFGQNNWAARLPFAIAGWLTIVVAYLCAYDLIKNRWVGFCSAILLLTSVQFLLYCRQCRYYALSMLLSALLVWVFFNLRSIRSALTFTLVSILLFHSHPFGIVLVCALFLIGFVWPTRLNGVSSYQQRRFLALAALIFAVFIVPWIVFVRSGYAVHSEPVSSLGQFLGRVIQYAIESVSVTPIIGVVVLAFVCLVRDRRREAPRETEVSSLDRRPRTFLIITFATLVCYAAAMAISSSSDDIWRLGIRYSTALLPLIAIAAAILIVRISRGRVAIWLPLLLIFAFTKLELLTPWIFWGDKQTTFDGKELVRAHRSLQSAARYLAIPEQAAFVRDLVHQNLGALANGCHFFKTHANASDLVLTNYDWQPLYFYTRLPQSLRIFPDYPIHQAARRKGLPEYVFNIDGVRWVFWRPAWGGLWEYVGSEISRDLVNRGARLTTVAQFPETIFENRPEIHFHRFSSNKYFYVTVDDHVMASIIRVDWPGVLRSDQ